MYCTFVNKYLPTYLPTYGYNHCENMLYEDILPCEDILLCEDIQWEIHDFELGNT